MAASSNDTRQALAQQLSEQVQAAAAERTPMSIQGGASKSFYGRRDASNHPVLTLTDYQGVISFEPTELTVTAAAGTPLVALEQTLAERNQQLPFEPPHFGPDATLGGTIACGLSGPARAGLKRLCSLCGQKLCWRDANPHPLMMLLIWPSRF